MKKEREYFFAFNGIYLDLPSAWQLNRYMGDCRLGRLAFDDGTEKSLTVEWAPCRRFTPEKVAEKYILSERTQQVLDRYYPSPGLLTIETISRGGYITHFIELQPDWNRFIIFRFFKPEKDIVKVFKRLTKPMKTATAAEILEWKVFAAHFRLDRQWLLTQSEMLAGCLKMTFSRNGRQLNIWDIAMLKRNLAKTDLATAGLEMVNQAFPKRLSLSRENLVPGKREGDFFLEGRRRRRWLLHPGELWSGNSQAWFQCITDPTRDRYVYLLLQYRRREELTWIHSLQDSLGYSNIATAADNVVKTDSLPSRGKLKTIAAGISPGH